MLAIHAGNLPDPLQVPYALLLKEFGHGMERFRETGVNFVWIGGPLKYRPSLEVVDQCLLALKPELLGTLKSFVVLGGCPWLRLVLGWLGEHYDPAGLRAFEQKLSVVADAAALQARWPGFSAGRAPTAYHTRLFGEPLEAVCQPETGAPPPQILDLLGWLAEHALQTDGLFRLSADASVLEWHKSVLNAGRRLELGDASRIDPNEMACLLKLYFRELPTPVVPRELYPLLGDVDDQDPGPAVARLRQHVLPQMPRPARLLLGELMGLLHRVAQHAAVNRMGGRNLAICWSPNLIYDELAPDQFRLLKAALATIELMIREYEAVFAA